uniref:Uncharacterized protein n=1 Tax=Arundo donax TaxID=35708 RepID=A0A0A8YHE1_ARUDO
MHQGKLKPITLINHNKCRSILNFIIFLKFSNQIFLLVPI